MYDYPCQIDIETRKTITGRSDTTTIYYKCKTTNRAIRIEISFGAEQDMKKILEDTVKSKLCGKCIYLHELKKPDHP